MPYITKEQRKELKEHAPDGAGELNFLITSIVDQYIATMGLSYRAINEAIGALECAKMELYRRVAAKYEDRKIKINGDVYNCDKQ